eukprot:5129131-Amphidinium_carterae.1
MDCNYVALHRVDSLESDLIAKCKHNGVSILTTSLPTVLPLISEVRGHTEMFLMDLLLASQLYNEAWLPVAKCQHADVMIMRSTVDL